MGNTSCNLRKRPTGVIVQHCDLLDPRTNAASRRKGATVFGYQTPDPEHYGVIASDEAGHTTSIEEKPLRPRSCWRRPT